MAKVLVTGGSGMIGTRLTEMLLERGYEVAHLGRTAGEKNGIITYQWNWKTNDIDSKAFINTEYIINLSGANVNGHRWNQEYKNIIYRSRVHSTGLLIHNLKIRTHRIKRLVQASAIGIYDDNYDGYWDESSPLGNKFLADVCKEWEQAASEGLFIRIEPVIARIGIVLSERGGFINEVEKPIRMKLGAALGKGDQKMSWIHLDDVCEMLIHLMTIEKVDGAYNAVADEAVTNEIMMEKIAAHMDRSIKLPNIPAFLLKQIFGEITEELLSSHQLSNEKIKATGFKFKYPHLDEALNDIFSKK